MKITFFFLAGLLLLFQATLVILALPPVQNRLVQAVRQYFSNKWGVRIDLARIDVALPAKAVLEGLVIYTPENQELIRLEALRMNVLDFDLWNYLFAEKEEDQAISLGSLDLIAPVPPG